MGRDARPTTVLIFHNVPILDDLPFLAACVILPSALSSISISFDYIKGQKINSFEYIVLILFPTLGMPFIVSAHDPVGMYPAIELQSLSSYVIAASQRDNEFPAEAGPKYSILGALSPGLSPSGESIPHGLTGITDFEEPAKLFTLPSGSLGGPLAFPSDSLATFSSEGLVVNAIAPGSLSILVAFSFKISAVPSHM